MATIDPSIAMGYKPVQIENPLNQLAAYSQIERGQQDQQLNALKMRQAQQDFDTQNALAEAYKGAFNQDTGALDYNLLTKQLAQRGAGSAIPALLKTQRETQQAEALLGKTNVETQEAKRKLVTGMSRDLSRNPSDANIQAHFEDFASSKLFTPNEILTAQAKRDQLLAMPIPDRQAYLASQGATAGELKPTIKDTDIGGQIITRQFDPFKGTPTNIGQPIVKTPTFADIASQGQLGVAQQRLKLEQDKDRRDLTMGTIPAGYRLNKVTNELEAIPGGPTTVALSPKDKQKREAAYPKATSGLKAFDDTSNSLIKDLAELRNHPGLSSITGIVAGRLPGATKDGRAAQALYDKIVARGGFQALTDLKAAGGTLGAVSNQEGTQLKDSWAAINRTQDAADVRKALDQALATVQTSKDRIRDEYDTTYEYRNTVPRSNAASPAAPNQTKSGATVSNW